jgi:hypothetical protein
VKLFLFIIAEFKPTIVDRSSNNSSKTKIIGIVLGVLSGLGVVLCSSCMILKRRKRRKDKSLTSGDNEGDRLCFQTWD